MKDTQEVRVWGHSAQLGETSADFLGGGDASPAG